MSKIVVLGAGMIGSCIAYDLSKKHKVTSVDLSEENLKRLKLKCNITTIVQNLSNIPELQNLIKPFDLVVNAVPGFLGF